MPFLKKSINLKRNVVKEKKREPRVQWKYALLFINEHTRQTRLDVKNGTIFILLTLCLLGL